jgi:hypothetical protein
MDLVGDKYLHLNYSIYITRRSALNRAIARGVYMNQDAKIF